MLSYEDSTIRVVQGLGKRVLRRKEWRNVSHRTDRSMGRIEVDPIGWTTWRHF